MLYWYRKSVGAERFYGGETDTITVARCLHLKRKLFVDNAWISEIL